GISGNAVPRESRAVRGLDPPAARSQPLFRQADAGADARVRQQAVASHAPAMGAGSSVGRQAAGQRAAPQAWGALPIVRTGDMTMHDASADDIALRDITSDLRIIDSALGRHLFVVDGSRIYDIPDDTDIE